MGYFLNSDIGNEDLYQALAGNNGVSGNAANPAYVSPMQPPAPAGEGNWIDKVRGIANNLGTFLGSPGGQRALMLGANTANIVGNNQNWRTPLAQYLGGAMAGSAIPKAVNAPNPVSSVAPATPVASPTPTTAAQTQSKMKALSDALRGYQTSTSIESAGEPIPVAPTNNAMPGVMTPVNPTSGVDNTAAVLSTPQTIQPNMLPNAVPSALPNAVMSQNTDNSADTTQPYYDLIASTLGPEGVIKTMEARNARQKSESERMTAEAAHLTAAEKYSNRDVERSKIIAETSKNYADTQKATSEAALKVAELNSTGPYDPQNKGLAEYYKEKAKVTAEAEGKALELTNYLNSPAAKVKIPPAIKAANGLGPEVDTYGDFVALNKDAGVVKSLFDLFNRSQVAGIRSAGESRGQLIGALAQSRMLHQGTITSAEKDLTRVTSIFAQAMARTPEQKAALANEELSIRSRLENANASLLQTDKWIQQVSGFKADENKISVSAGRRRETSTRPKDAVFGKNKDGVTGYSWKVGNQRMFQPAKE
jgi:hypothetical protein